MTLSEELAPALDFPPERSPEPLDREYWLEHCEGFRVDCTGGRIGFVEEVRSSEATAGKRTLAVRAGMLGRRRLLVPADEVAFIVPRAERIWLSSSPMISGSEAPAGRHAGGSRAGVRRGDGLQLAGG